MNEGLVAAQQLREETRAAAQREAQVIVREAEAEARRVVEEARAAQGEVQRQSADVERQFQAYVAGFRALLERSEEHTSELQSQSNLVCRLLLGKKKKRHRQIHPRHTVRYILTD